MYRFLFDGVLLVYMCSSTSIQVFFISSTSVGMIRIAYLLQGCGNYGERFFFMELVCETLQNVKGFLNDTNEV